MKKRENQMFNEGFVSGVAFGRQQYHLENALRKATNAKKIQEISKRLQHHNDKLNKKIFDSSNSNLTS